MIQAFYLKLKVLTALIFILLESQRLCRAKNSPSIGDLKTRTFSYQTIGGETAKYQTGTFYVKENRNNPNSRVIGIGFSRFPSTNSKTLPIFFLPGGPGSSFLEGVPPFIHRSGGPLLAEEMLGRCDMVFLDQRGFSKRGTMLDDRAFIPGLVRPDATLEDRISEFRRFSLEVVDRYAESEVDLRGYSVLECVEDVNELRQLLGYEKIILCGQSFGSQWSFGVMKKHPDTVERALLTGIEPLNNGYDMPSHVFNAIRRIWKTIDEDPRFKPYLPSGGMEAAAETVIKRLEANPVEIFADGTTNLLRTIVPDDFPWREPDAILELLHGRFERWASPRSLQIVPRTLIQPLIDSSLGTTAKRRWKLWNDPATRYLSRSNFAPLLATADIWPSPDVGDEFRIPVKCEIPVVFVNGDWDTKTPVENMYEIAPYFPNSHQVVLHRAGHGTMKLSTKEQHPDFFGKLVNFLQTGKTKDLPLRLTVIPYKSFRVPDFTPDTSLR